MMNQYGEGETTSEPQFDDLAVLFGHPGDRLIDFGHPSDLFIDGFGGCCASLVILLNAFEELDAPASLDASNDILLRLCDVAATVGYPVVGEFTAHVASPEEPDVDSLTRRVRLGKDRLATRTSRHAVTD
jgi:hypothetical protein